MKKHGARTLLFVLLLAALAPVSASAERRFCDSYCSCFTPCASTCYWGSFLETCGVAGPCTEQCNGTAAKAPDPGLTPTILACQNLNMPAETALPLAKPAPAKVAPERPRR